MYEAEIEKQLKRKKRVVIAIDGPSGSGKSTLGKQLSTKYNCPLIRIDDYFLPSNMKTKERLETPGGNFHIERLINEVFDNIDTGLIISTKFDCTIQKLLKPTKIKAEGMIIIEGVYSMHPLLVKYYTLKLFINVSKEEQIRRIRTRNGEEMLNKWINEWIPLENKYFNHFSIEKKADFSITL